MSSLRAKLLGGFFWSFMQRVGVVLVSFISNILLARMLMPSDYGCIGMLMIFIALSNTFIDGGFGSALIQKKEPTQADYSTIFFWNLFLSILLYGLLYMAAPVIARFYHIDLLTSVLRVQGLVLIINALGLVQQNILRKRLLFKNIAFIKISASVLSLFVAAYLAYHGYGVWALVAQQLSWSCIATFLYWVSRVWYPSWVFSMQSFKELFHFGGFILLANLVTTFTDNLQGIIIGRLFTPATMGLYTQARRLEEAVATTMSSVVDQVSYPVFAEVQENKERLLLVVRKIITVSAYVCFPVMFLLMLVAEPIIAMLYLEKWLACVPYFRILCVAGLMTCIYNLNYFAVAAVGRSKSLFRLNILQSVISIVLMLLGVYWKGMHGLLWGMVLGIYTNYVLYAVLSAKIVGYKLLQQFLDLLPIALVGALTSLLVGYIAEFLHGHTLVVLALQVLLFGGIYVGVSMLMQLQATQWLKELVRTMRK